MPAFTLARRRPDGAQNRESLIWRYTNGVPVATPAIGTGRQRRRPVREHHVGTAELAAQRAERAHTEARIAEHLDIETTDGALGQRDGTDGAPLIHERALEIDREELRAASIAVGDHLKDVRRHDGQ